MRKFKIFVDIEKEEKYLNEMAKKGYIFKKYTIFGFYHFVRGTPADLNYRVDYRGFTKNSDFEDYKLLFEDAGWKHVYGTKYGYNQYFLPKEGTNDSDIFSTEESKADRYKRFINVCISSLTLAVIYFIMILSGYGYNLSEIGFLTPGLWEMSGCKFWRAFLFEFPFMLLRTVPVFVLVVMGILYGVWAYKARKLYKLKTKSE